MTNQQQQQPARSSNRTRITVTIAVAILVVIVVLFFIAANLYTDVLWYDQVGFLGVLTTQWVASAIMFLIGFVGMALPVWLSIEIAFRSRPVYAKLNSQLDRYQQVIEPLRRLVMFGCRCSSASSPACGRRPAGRSRSSGSTRPRSGRPIRSSGSTSPSTSTTCRSGTACSGSPRPSSSSCVVATVATSYLYGALRLSGRELRISRSARIQLAILLAIYLALQAGEHLVRPVPDPDLGERRVPEHGRRLHRGERDHPGSRDPRRHRRDRRRALHRDGHHRALAPADHRHRAAHHQRAAGRQHLPVDRPALPGRPERAHAGGRVHPAQHRRDPRRLRRGRRRGDARTARPRMRSRASCARTPRRRPTSASSIPRS